MRLDFRAGNPIFVGLMDTRRTWLAFAGIGVAAAALFGLRLLAPLDLFAYAQDMPVMYVLDAVVNGHWFCQRDALGAVTSKPPMYTWLAGLASLAAGRVTWFSLCLPSGLATLGTAWVIMAAGRRWLTLRAGIWAALVYLLSPAIGKQLTLVRTDPLFTFTVALAAVAAFAAWERGRGWTWFWLAAAAATLTKGPLGVALGAAGLMAVLWERRTGQPAALRGQHYGGVALYGVLTLGWFVLALATEGRAVVDKMIFRELVRHSTGAGSEVVPLAQAYKPTLYFLARFAPWSLLTCVALWRVARQPSAEATERRFERFLSCWLVVGLILFSVVAHVRPDLGMPLLPAAALLAGRELQRWSDRQRGSTVAWAMTTVVVIGLTLMCAFWFVRREPASVLHTRGMKKLAKELTAQVGTEFPFTYVDRTFALQFFLGTMRERVAQEQALRLLAEPTPAYVVVRRSDKLSEHLPAGLHVVARWPAKGQPFVTVISNHPRLEWTEQLAFGIGPFSVRTQNLHLRLAYNGVLWFRTDGAGAVSVKNENAVAHKIRLRVTGPSFDRQAERELAPGESWEFSAQAPAPLDEASNAGFDGHLRVVAQ